MHPRDTLRERLGPSDVQGGTGGIDAYDVEAHGCQLDGECACAAPDIDNAPGAQFFGQGYVAVEVGAVTMEPSYTAASRGSA